jgi:hypothetical protein
MDSNNIIILKSLKDRSIGSHVIKIGLIDKPVSINPNSVNISNSIKAVVFTGASAATTSITGVIALLMMP